MQTVRERKYFKPKSLTWWASFVPLAAGCIVATQDFQEWTRVISSIDRASGEMTASQLIFVGLGGIGLRGAAR